MGSNPTTTDVKKNRYRVNNTGIWFKKWQVKDAHLQLSGRNVSEKSI